MNNAMMSYKQAQINTIGRAEIVLAMYDGAIKFLEQAEIKIKENDMVAKGNLISRVIDILNELDSSLNLEVGGEVGQSLHGFYGLCNRNLLFANLRLDLELLRNTKENIKSVRNAFAEAMQTSEAKETLQRMGPLPQVSSSNITNNNLGSDISNRSDILKQMEQKAKALELAKQNIQNAGSEEEKLQAEQALKNTLLHHKNQENPMYNPNNQGLVNRKMALYKNMQNA